MQQASVLCFNDIISVISRTQIELMTELTHIDSQGNANMVDISEKPVTERVAAAAASITMNEQTLEMLIEGNHKKGDVLTIAKFAGIQAAKRCSDLIPLCHPLMLNNIDISLEIDREGNRVLIESTCKVSGKTGVEMEALTAASVTALTIYDMCKAVDRGMLISDIRLLHKSGGASGTYDAP